MSAGSFYGSVPVQVPPSMTSHNRLQSVEDLVATAQTEIESLNRRLDEFEAKFVLLEKKVDNFEEQLAKVGECSVPNSQINKTAAVRLPRKITVRLF